MSVLVGNSDFRPLPTNPTAKITGVHESLLQECEKDIIWYREHFVGKAHHNYLAVDSPRGPLAISLIHDASASTFKVLVRSTQGSERLTVAAQSVPNPWWRKAMGLLPTNESVMQTVSSNIPLQCLKHCKETSKSNLPNELLAMEERQVIRSYKFGLTYLGSGQATEEEMFSNKHEHTSQGFKQFLNFLGETIELKGWKGYRAGLDTQSNNTGTHSVYTKWQGYEVMFHVATMLPYAEKDRQQLERKRHVGNDIVVIVYQDTDTPYQLSTNTSHQNHIIAVVQPCGEGYKLCLAPKNGVPPFSPEMPEPPIFFKDAVSRDFFFHKLINGERACYKAPSFAPKISRTRQVLLTELATKFIK
ncbi:uncharacterized protein BJ171DRAFT_462005 [Polychytrium aggregatum]|uniref:uncharacterized protein n=1 Tax=Polychytrium aggregatum TaxID=110093 RepID=UPI0022FDFDB6|nr:uncharacterized protein BJ171DRAFT_462005 [Polychytrium aggregatum]KAI9199796.1 hypothetical protein BJ171DRAFT_462005 [Polychytrium aggregatum]